MMVELLKAAGVDPTQHIKFEPVYGKDENGNQTVEYYPTVQEHATAKKSIDYDAEIAARTQGKSEKIGQEDKFEGARMEALERANEDLQKRLDQLLDKLGGDNDVKPSKLPFKLTVGQKKQMLKSMGIDPKGMTKEEIDAALED